MLEHYHAQATKNKEIMENAKEDLTKTLQVHVNYSTNLLIYYSFVVQAVKKVADKVKDHDPYRPYVDKILEKVRIYISGRIT